MKRNLKWILTIMVFSYIFFSCNEDSEETLWGNWIEKSDFEGTTRSSAVSFVIDDIAYVGTGYNSVEEEYYQDFWKYDPDLNFWQRVADCPGEGRSSAVAFSINGKGFVGTGFDGKDALGDFWMYNPVSDEWTRVSDFPGTPRYGAVAFSIAGRGYVGTGYDGSDTKDFWEYDPSMDQWLQIPSIGGSKRKNAIAFVFDNKAYVTTGIHNGFYEYDIWEFDPTQIELGEFPWSERRALDDESIEDYIIVREDAVSFVMGDKAYLVTGKQSYYIQNVYEYDPLLDRWNEKTSFEGTSRADAISFTINGRSYVALGRNGTTFLDDIWEFKPNELEDEDD